MCLYYTNPQLYSEIALETSFALSFLLKFAFKKNEFLPYCMFYVIIWYKSVLLVVGLLFLADTLPLMCFNDAILWVAVCK